MQHNPPGPPETGRMGTIQNLPPQPPKPIFQFVWLECRSVWSPAVSEGGAEGPGEQSAGGGGSCRECHPQPGCDSQCRHSHHGGGGGIQVHHSGYATGPGSLFYQPKILLDVSPTSCVSSPPPPPPPPLTSLRPLHSPSRLACPLQASAGTASKAVQ